VPGLMRVEFLNVSNVCLNSRRWFVLCLVYISYLVLVRSRDSAVGIATGNWLDDRGVGVRVPVGSKIFTFRSRPGWLWGSPILLFNGYGGLFPRGKAAGA
jgi:hypothetical protein